jgi:hypothetical protein
MNPRQGQSPQPQRAFFVGRWKLVNDKGVVSLNLTVTKLGAKWDHTPTPGKWEVVGNDARFTWADGGRDIMRREEDGRITFLELGGATSWDSPPNRRYRGVRIAQSQLELSFVGRWKLVNDKGVTSSYLTVTSSFDAKRDHAPNAPGKWEVVGNEARFTWEDGFRDILRLEDNGNITMLGLGKMPSSWDGLPVFQLKAIRVEPPEVIPGVTTGEWCREYLRDWRWKQKGGPKLLRPELFERVDDLLTNDPDAKDEAAYVALWEEVEGGVKERKRTKKLGAPRKNEKAVDHAIEMRKVSPRPPWKEVWAECKSLRVVAQTYESFKAAVMQREREARN